ncbi:aminotransferase class V-fold PLP-dependent enzyme [Sorangium atrum]|uniref:Aminotransferase class V-fold PLP-dependent enzyme n=1 Tax=Sorangium atrum TaxID=2995308 RepID=A0ABT5BZV3_9BACT|nr:aminotransferase class V-fold PLP-dependent enzyme [Sorangium aterium]MDC0679632.1 aminotransferase class V-fold PLP-dependent enzyme [Sorangium aterium]
MTMDIAALRRDTPACAGVLHFNNAGSSLPPAVVVDTVVEHLRREAAVGGYEAEEEAGARLEAVYGSIARLIGAAPDEIALVENATRAWDMAFYSLRFGPGDRILTARTEYASNYIAFLQVARRTGAEIVPIPSDERGAVSLPALDRLIDERVKLIAITHVPTNGGLVNPAEEIGRRARSAGVPFLLDACQSVGQLPLDVEAIGCDLLSATGRKYLRGPRGTGFLYVRRALLDRLEPPFLDLHAARWTAPDRYELRPDARRFENWESYVAGRLGLGAAAEYALRLGLPAIRDRVGALAERLRARLSEVPGVTVRDLGERRCGIVTFTRAGEDAAAIKARLGAQAIHVSVSTAAGTLLDFEDRGIPDLVRASVHYYNDESEVDRFVAALTEA